MSSRPDLIPIGEAAPDFTAALSDGGSFRLASIYGQKCLVLVFYPGDNTPTCTAQLCAMRDEWEHLQARDTFVYGVNPAGAAKHAAFAAHNRFPFPLIADAGGKIAAAYGCRMIFGLIRRTVYIIDKQGRIAYAQRGNPTSEEILRVLETIQDAEKSADDAQTNDGIK